MIRKFVLVNENVTDFCCILEYIVIHTGAHTLAWTWDRNRCDKQEIVGAFFA